MEIPVEPPQHPSGHDIVCIHIHVATQNLSQLFLTLVVPPIFPLDLTNPILYTHGRIVGALKKNAWSARSLLLLWI